MKMVPRSYPERILELKKIFEPYMIGCHFKEGTPPEAKEAFEEFKKWAQSLPQ